MVSSHGLAIYLSKFDVLIIYIIILFKINILYQQHGHSKKLESFLKTILSQKEH